MVVIIHDLALELLCRIFDMTVFYDDIYLAKRKSPRAALTLSHTCSHWRRVCISYSGLWTFLPWNHMSSELRQLFMERTRTSAQVAG